MSDRDPTTTVQLKFRVKEGLRAELEAAAKRHALTLNAEIVRRLEESFQIDQRKREMDIMIDNALRGAEAAEVRAAEDRRRANALTDYILERQAPGIRMPRPEEPK